MKLGGGFPVNFKVPFPGLVFHRELMVVKCEPFTSQGKGRQSSLSMGGCSFTPQKDTMSGNVVTEDSQQD